MKNSINKKIFIFIIIFIVLNLGTMKTYGITDMDSLTNINNTFDLDNTIDVDNSIIDNDNTDEKQEEKISVSYSSHIQDIGWENDSLKKDGETSGTSGQALRLEAMKIKLNSSEIGIKYQTHIQDIGWQDWKKMEKCLVHLAKAKG